MGTSKRNSLLSNYRLGYSKQERREGGNMFRKLKFFWFLKAFLHAVNS